MPPPATICANVASSFVHVTTLAPATPSPGPSPLQSHPSLRNLSSITSVTPPANDPAPVARTPCGNLSVTVTVPVLLAAPMFTTRTSTAPLPPGARSVGNVCAATSQPGAGASAPKLEAHCTTMPQRTPRRSRINILNLVILLLPPLGQRSLG